MSETRIADLFRVRSRFLRSAHLERDFNDPRALDGYVVTPQAEEYLRRMTAGLAPSSGQRAWRITGDYGVGKSSFALLLAHLLAGRQGRPLPKLRKELDSARPTGRKWNLLPILVTGSREPMALAILRTLSHTLESFHDRGRRPKVIDEIRDLLRANDAVMELVPGTDAAVVKLIGEASAFVRNSGHASGLLVILDELGKFLEFAAARPERQDVFFLQLLGEAAARSGEHSVVVVGLLHQGFNAYADRLSEPAQREWQKVAGRFEELLFDRPLDQTLALVADALNVDEGKIFPGMLRAARSDMAAVSEMGWYGPRPEASHLRALAGRIYPLHPTVVPVLTRLLSRFGQNERSLFSFMLSSEPHALQAFAEQGLADRVFYRLPELYDYARAVFGSRLGRQSYRSHWPLIESVVESFATTHPLESQILKTVAILNLVDDQGLLATDLAIELAVGRDDVDRRKVRSEVAKLQKKRVLYSRGVSGGYCLWPHTSVNIESAYLQSQKVISSLGPVSSIIAGEFDTRPVVARRHYIETGNLRHFAVKCVAPREMDEAFAQALQQEDADGVIILPLCETSAGRRAAVGFARSELPKSHPAIVIAVPQPLETLRALVLEAQRWQWVADSTPELAHDRYAAEEVSRQVLTSRRVLRDRIQDLVGLRSFSARTELDWFHRGEELLIGNSRELLAALSSVCDAV